MASKAQQVAVWPLWLLLIIGWILVLSGVAALQHNCFGSDVSDPLLGAGTVAYLSPVGCGKFYRFTWWITFYLLAVCILIAAFAAARAFHTFRRAGVPAGAQSLVGRSGILGLSAPLLVLLMDTCNTYFYFNGLQLTGTTKARARVTLAGSIIACIALFALLLVIGVFDEEASKTERRGGTGEPKGQTYGGVYQPDAGQREAAEAATYGSPARVDTYG